MKTRLRIISAIILMVIMFSFTACSYIDTDENDLTVVTTIFPPYDFVRQISNGVDGVKIEMLLPLGSESHDYEPSVGDIALIGEADLIICVGGETDAWIDNVIDSAKSDASVLRLTDMVELLEEDTSVLVTESSHSHEHSHEHGDECVFDEHVWTSPENAAIITEKITAEMCRMSESNAEVFSENSSAYTKTLRDLQTRFCDAVRSSSRDEIIFADRFPFRYLTNSIGIGCHAAYSGCSSDSEVSLEAVYRLTELVTETDTSVIFTCEFSSQNAAKLIADETGAVIRELHSCHNVSREDFDRGVTYLSLMEENLICLKEALETEQH